MEKDDDVAPDDTHQQHESRYSNLFHQISGSNERTAGVVYCAGNKLPSRQTQGHVRQVSCDVEREKLGIERPQSGDKYRRRKGEPERAQHRSSITIENVVPT